MNSSGHPKPEPMPSQTKLHSHCHNSYTPGSRLTHHVSKHPPQCTLPKISSKEVSRVRSVIKVGQSHAALEIESAKTLVSRVDVCEAVVERASEGVLEGLLLESVLLGSLPGRSGFGDTAVGDD